MLKRLTNDNGEVTGAIVMKGNKEIVKRHSSSLIPILSVDEYDNAPRKSCNNKHIKTNNDRKILPKRKAAEKSREKILNMRRDGNI